MKSFKSSIRELEWPALMTGPAATLTSLLHQYDRSQWWSAEKIRDAQFIQLTILAEHSLRTVPFQAERLKAAGFTSGKPMTPEIWSRLPILKRDDVRDFGEKLYASSYPPSFGGTSVASSGGSTGIPVRVLKTSVDGLMWQAAHLREFQWNDIDFSLEIANLRHISPESFKNKKDSYIDNGGVILSDWGHPATLLRETGPMGILQPFEPLDLQSEFLIKRRPGYLIMRPAGLRLLLCHFREHGMTLDSIRSVWTLSESVDESLRELCHEIFGCRIFSNYTSHETGYIALQCPSGTNYHAVSESVLVEVVDEEGNPCKPGEIGRVLVTPLHNFAMPLLRYQVGDEAEVGHPCACGRGLLSLTRVVGRLEDYVKLRSGVKRRVDVEHYKISAIPAVREFQLVQTTLDSVELRLVVTRSLHPQEMDQLDAILKKCFEGYLSWSLVFVAALPRTPAGKLRQFISEV